VSKEKFQEELLTAIQPLADKYGMKAEVLGVNLITGPASLDEAARLGFYGKEEKAK
jgi:hypothetical protein